MSSIFPILDIFPTVQIRKEENQRVNELFLKDIVLRSRTGHSVTSRIGIVFKEICRNLKKHVGEPKRIDLIGSSATYCLSPLIPPGDIDIAFEYSFPESEDDRYFEAIKNAIICSLKTFFGITDEAVLWKQYFWKRTVASLPSTPGMRAPKFALFGIGPDKNSCLEIKICVGNFRKYVTSRDAFFIKLSSRKRDVGSFALNVGEALKLLKDKKFETKNPHEILRGGFERYISAVTSGFSDDSRIAFHTFYKQFKSGEEVYRALVDFYDNHYFGRDSDFEYVYYINALTSIYLLEGTIDPFVEISVRMGLRRLKPTSPHLCCIQDSLSSKTFEQIFIPFQLVFSLKSKLFHKMHLEKQVDFLTIQSSTNTCQLLIPAESFEFAVKQFVQFKTDRPDFLAIVLKELLGESLKTNSELSIPIEFLSLLDILCGQGNPYYAYYAWKILSLFPACVPSAHLIASLKSICMCFVEAQKDQFNKEIEINLKSLTWERLKQLDLSFTEIIEYIEFVYKENCPYSQSLTSALLEDLITYTQACRIYKSLKHILKGDDLNAFKYKMALLGLESPLNCDRQESIKLITELEAIQLEESFAIVLKHFTKERSFELLDILLKFFNKRIISAEHLYTVVDRYYFKELSSEGVEFEFAYFFNILTICSLYSLTSDVHHLKSRIYTRLKCIKSEDHIQFLSKYIKKVSVQALMSPYSIILTLLNSKVNQLHDKKIYFLPFKSQAIIAIPALEIDEVFEKLTALDNVVDNFDFHMIINKLMEFVLKKRLKFPENLVQLLEKLCKSSKPNLAYLVWRLLGAFPEIAITDEMVRVLPAAIKVTIIMTHQVDFLNSIRWPFIKVFGEETFQYIQEVVSIDRTGKSLAPLIDFHVNTQLGLPVSLFDLDLDLDRTLKLFLMLFSSKNINLKNVVEKFKEFIIRHPRINFEIIADIVLRLNETEDLVDITEILEQILMHVKDSKLLYLLRGIYLEKLKSKETSIDFIKAVYSAFESVLKDKELGALFFGVSSRLLISSDIQDQVLGKQLFVRGVLENPFEDDFSILKNESIVLDIFDSLSQLDLENEQSLKDRCKFFRIVDRKDLSDKLEKNFTQHLLQVKKVDMVFHYLIEQIRECHSDDRLDQLHSLIFKASFYYFDKDFVQNIKLISTTYTHLKSDAQFKLLLETFKDDIFKVLKKIDPDDRDVVVNVIDFFLPYFEETTRDSEFAYFISFLDKVDGGLQYILYHDGYLETFPRIEAEMKKIFGEKKVPIKSLINFKRKSVKSAAQKKVAPQRFRFSPHSLRVSVTALIVLLYIVWNKYQNYKSV